MHKSAQKNLARGARVRVLRDAGFHAGALGVIEFVEPAQDRVWVLRDHASSPVWFSAAELEVVTPALGSDFEHGARAMFDGLVLMASTLDSSGSAIVLSCAQKVLGDVSPASSKRWQELSQMYEKGLERGRAALSSDGGEEASCSKHPHAPHGFLRSASHANSRYVCECEAWEPYEAGYQAGFDAAYKLLESEDV